MSPSEWPPGRQSVPVSSSAERFRAVARRLAGFSQLSRYIRQVGHEIAELWLSMLVGITVLICWFLWLMVGPNRVDPGATQWFVSAMLQGSAALLGLVVVSLTFTTDRARSAEAHLLRRASEYERRLGPFWPDLVEHTAKKVRRRIRDQSPYRAVADALDAQVKVCVALTRATARREWVATLFEAKHHRQPTLDELGRMEFEYTKQGVRVRNDMRQLFDCLLTGILFSEAEDLPFWKELEAFLDEYRPDVIPSLRQLKEAEWLRAFPARLAVALLALTFVVSAAVLPMTGNKPSVEFMVGWVTVLQGLAGFSIIALAGALHRLFL